MKSRLQIMMAIVIGISLAVSPCFAGDLKYSGFLGDYYKNLKPGKKDGAKKSWFKPGVDFSKYKKVMIDSVIFYYDAKSKDRGIDANEMKELADAFDLELVNALKDGYTIVADPAADVLRLRVAITNIKKSQPVRSAITSVLPVGIGISIITKGVTDSWTGSGATAAELMGMDSVSSEVVAVAVDEQTAGFTERFSELGSAKEAFKSWAQRIRIIMDENHRRTSMKTEDQNGK